MNRKITLVLFLADFGLGTFSLGRGQSARGSSHSTAQQTVSPAEPAGAARCRFCHPSEVEGYARSAMAHSLRRAGQEPDGEVDTPDAKTIHSSLAGY
jgi:hypothetical protein